MTHASTISASSASSRPAPPRPGDQAPALEMETVTGGRWTLADRNPESFTMIVFYRGLHCPVCRGYLSELEGLLDDYGSRGVEVVAVSSDKQDRAEKSRMTWDLERLTIGYGINEETMRSWGLFISNGRLDNEPERYGEPGLFLVRPRWGPLLTSRSTACHSAGPSCTTC